MGLKIGNLALTPYFLLMASFLITSCTTARVADPAELKLDELSAYHDERSHYRGAVHIHTRYSHDTTAPLHELRDALVRHKMDYAIVTDHGTLEGKKLFEGMHEKTLWIFGSELSTDAGKYLALDAPLTFEDGVTARGIINNVQAKGGMGFIAHPFSKREPWRDWTLDGFTGMEIYNAADDLYDEPIWWFAVRWLYFPKRLFGLSIFDRPDQALVQWDMLTKKRRVVGIGGNDAHGNLRVTDYSLAGYDFMLSRVSTYLLAGRLVKDELLRALGQGHAYIAFEQQGDARSFMFHAINGRQHVIMGDEIPLTQATEIRAWSPHKAHIRLFKDGALLHSINGQELRSAVSEPGVYRAEVYVRKKLWIISNPIYVRSS